MNEPPATVFDRMPPRRQIELIRFVCGKFAWSEERAEGELRQLDHVGLAYLGVDMRLHVDEARILSSQQELGRD